MHLFKACISKKEICQNWIALNRSQNLNLNDKSSCLKTYQKLTSPYVIAGPFRNFEKLFGTTLIMF